MREKIRARERMMTADQAREEIRSPLDLLIRHQVAHGTSRMRAYERVGTQIGRTPAWIQRVLGRRPDTAIGLHDALNIRAAYDRLVARVATAADAAEAHNDRLREELDAALRARAAVVPGPAYRPLDGAAAARRPGRAPAPALVRTHARPRAAVAGDLNDLPLWRALKED